MSDSTALTVPRKPHKDFPLTPRGDGRWCKKVRGKIHYFTATADEAIKEWLRVKDDLLAGRTPRPDGDGLTVEDLLDHFLNTKRPLMESGEITKRTYQDYFATCQRIGKAFGLRRLADDLRAADFAAYRASIAKVWGPVALGNEINRVRIVFKFGFDAELLDKTTRFGPGFNRPSRKTLRKVIAEAAWQARRRSPTVRAYFDRVQHGDPQRKKIALVATGHYLVRVMWAMLRRGTYWQENPALTKAYPLRLASSRRQLVP